MSTRPFIQLFSTNGDGTGTTVATGNYASAAETFEVANPSSVATTTIVRMFVTIGDSGSFDAEKYGNGVTLTNGVTLSVVDSSDNLIVDLSPDPIKSNVGWAKYCYDAEVKSWGTGEDFLVARLSFNRFVLPNGVELTDGEKMVVTLNDDFSGLTDHVFLAQGFDSGSI